MEEAHYLVIRAQNGDKEAYGQLYKTYYARIYRFCRINLSNNEAAEDVCQGVFIRAWKALPTFSEKNGGTFQAYIFRIARNLIIDISRKKKEVPIENAQYLATDEDLLENLDRKNEIESVRNALGQLKEYDRQIIILRYFEDLSHAETASIMGIRQGALRVRTMRLLQKLKELIRK